MDIYYCPACAGKPYTTNTKTSTKCPVCGATLKYEDVLEQSLQGRQRISYPKKKTNNKTVSHKKDKEKNSVVALKYKKRKTISGTVENIRPCIEEPRSFFTKLRHYIMYGQSWTDTLYSFEIKPRDDETGNDRIKVHIYGDYYGDGATVCSGFEHTVKGHMAIRNISENDNDIFFARKIRNDNCEIRFVKSPFAFMMTVFIAFFIYMAAVSLKKPFLSGTLLEEIKRIFNEFIPSAKAAVCMFSIIFIISSAYIYINRSKTHIQYNFNTIGIFSFLVTTLFFIKYDFYIFRNLSFGESTSMIFSLLLTSSLKIITALLGTYVLWKIIQLIKRIR